MIPVIFPPGRSSVAANPTATGWNHRCEDDGNLPGYVLNRPNPDRAECNDDVYIETDEFGGKRRNSVELSFGKSRLDQNVAALDITQLSKAPTKCVNGRRRPSKYEQANTRDFVLLRH